jgi:hypothetical protein
MRSKRKRVCISTSEHLSSELLCGERATVGNVTSASSHFRVTLSRSRHCNKIRYDDLAN